MKGHEVFDEVANENLGCAMISFLRTEFPSVGFRMRYESGVLWIREGEPGAAQIAAHNLLSHFKAGYAAKVREDNDAYTVLQTLYDEWATLDKMEILEYIKTYLGLD